MQRVAGAVFLAGAPAPRCTGTTARPGGESVLRRLGSCLVGACCGRSGWSWWGFSLFPCPFRCGFFPLSPFFRSRSVCGRLVLLRVGFGLRSLAGAVRSSSWLRRCFAAGGVVGAVLGASGASVRLCSWRRGVAGASLSCFPRWFLLRVGRGVGGGVGASGGGRLRGGPGASGRCLAGLPRAAGSGVSRGGLGSLGRLGPRGGLALSGVRLLRGAGVRFSI